MNSKIFQLKLVMSVDNILIKNRADRGSIAFIMYNRQGRGCLVCFLSHQMLKHRFENRSFPETLFTIQVGRAHKQGNPEQDMNGEKKQSFLRYQKSKYCDCRCRRQRQSDLFHNEVNCDDGKCCRYTSRNRQQLGKNKQ